MEEENWENALKNHLILKNIFKYLAINELKNLRFVCKLWNFEATRNIRAENFLSFKSKEEFNNFYNFSRYDEEKEVVLLSKKYSFAFDLEYEPFHRFITANLHYLSDLNITFEYKSNSSQNRRLYTLDDLLKNKLLSNLKILKIENIPENMMTVTSKNKISQDWHTFTTVQDLTIISTRQYVLFNSFFFESIFEAFPNFETFTITAGNMGTEKQFSILMDALSKNGFGIKLKNLYLNLHISKGELQKFCKIAEEKNLSVKSFRYRKGYCGGAETKLFLERYKYELENFGSEFIDETSENIIFPSIMPKLQELYLRFGVDNTCLINEPINYTNQFPSLKSLSIGFIFNEYFNFRNEDEYLKVFDHFINLDKNDLPFSNLHNLTIFNGVHLPKLIQNANIIFPNLKTIKLQFELFAEFREEEIPNILKMWGSTLESLILINFRLSSWIFWLNLGIQIKMEFNHKFLNKITRGTFNKVHHKGKDAWKISFKYNDYFDTNDEPHLFRIEKQLKKLLSSPVGLASSQN